MLVASTMIVWHNHHIIPIHDGGTDDPRNLLKCNVAMHAFLHEQRYKELGQWQDKVAYKALRGLMSTAEAIYQVQINAGRANKGTSRSPEYREKMSQSRKKTFSEIWRFIES